MTGFGALQGPERLRGIMQSLAMLDAVLSPEWGGRRHSFDARWAGNEMMESMRNGSGDELFALFNAAGCFIKAFEHERPSARLSAADFYRDVPSCFHAAAAEPAFSPAEVTLCCWRRHEDVAWQGAGDSACELLLTLDGRAATYQAFAGGYFKTELDHATIAAVLGHAPLTEALMHRINPGASLRAALADAAGIGYPVEP